MFKEDIMNDKKKKNGENRPENRGLFVDLAGFGVDISEIHIVFQVQFSLKGSHRKFNTC